MDYEIHRWPDKPRGRYDKRLRGVLVAIRAGRVIARQYLPANASPQEVLVAAAKLAARVEEG